MCEIIIRVYHFWRTLAILRLSIILVYAKIVAKAIFEKAGRPVYKSKGNQEARYGK